MSTSWAPPRSFWTDDLPTHTDDGTAPYLYKAVLPPPVADPEAVLAGFARLRGALADGAEISAHARVYLGEERRDDLLDTVLIAEGWTRGAFVEWMQDLTGADRFGLVINNLETLSPELAAGLGAFLGCLLDGWGVPMGGAELVAFAGNYSSTAFGVHEGHENAFLLHFGPGDKDFYTWPQETYRKHTGGAEPLYGDYEWLLAHAEHHRLQPGDALFLPQRVFHVGRQDEFSVSVAMPIYTYPDATIVRRAVLPDLLDTLLAGAPDSPLGVPSPMAPLTRGSAPIGDRLAALATHTLAVAADQVSAVAHQHAHQRWNSILSNGGWELVAHDRSRSVAAAAFHPQDVTAGARVTVIKPYRLISAGTSAFLRGCEVTLAATLDPADVRALNTGADSPLVLTDDDGQLEAIRALGATGGLHIIPTPDAQQEDHR